MLAYTRQQKYENTFFILRCSVQILSIPPNEHLISCHKTKSTLKRNKTSKSNQPSVDFPSIPTSGWVLTTQKAQQTSVHSCCRTWRHFRHMQNDFFPVRWQEVKSFEFREKPGLTGLCSFWVLLKLVAASTFKAGFRCIWKLHPVPVGIQLSPKSALMMRTVWNKPSLALLMLDCQRAYQAVSIQWRIRGGISFTKTDIFPLKLHTLFCSWKLTWETTIYSCLLKLRTWG